MNDCFIFLISAKETTTISPIINGMELNYATFETRYSEIWGQNKETSQEISVNNNIRDHSKVRNAKNCRFNPPSPPCHAS